MIGYKKVALDRKRRRYGPHAIARLQTIGKVVRTTTGERKLRCRTVKVLSITSVYGKERYKEAYSIGIGAAVFALYRVGKVTTANGLTKDPAIDCSRGINFFKTKWAARAYRV